MLKCGFYEAEITPDLGYSMPGYFGPRPSEKALYPLYAHAFAAQAEGDPIIIISLDAIAVDKEDADAMKAGISKATGISEKNISIAATHTHTGGPVIELYGSPKEADYCKFMVGRAILAGVMAYKKMEDAKIGVASRNVEGIAFNRRFKMKNGSFETNPGFLNPEIECPVDIVDPEFLVLRVDHADGTPMGMIANFALHLDTVGKEGLSANSADYPGVIRKNLRKEYGEDFAFMFLTGTCGNVNHCDFSKPASEVKRYNEIGNILTEAARELFEGIETKDTDVVCCACTDITCQIRRPTLKECEEMPGHESLQIEMIRAAALPGGDVEMPVWTAMIGETAIQMLPGEVFTYFGVETKKGSGCKHTMVAELSNISVGYIYTKEAEKQGGYEATPSSYIIMNSDTGYRMVDAALENIKKLK